ncbi:MAG: LacI family DNA-binding transcriptional regulator [Capsulimonadaceae bacterium]|nr:LacI family DNA-binding transcriptional regulator [Capsulimonadaceae bacterium]
MQTALEPQTSFYKGLSKQIRAAIVETAQPGGKVVSERELARQFGVSSVTVARVLRDLQAAGLIERVRGKGTFLRGDQLARITPPVTGETVRPRLADPSAGGSRNAAQLQILILAGLAAINDDTPVSELWDYHAATGAERAMQKAGHITHTVNVCETTDEKMIGELNALLAAGLNGVVIIGDISLALFRRLNELASPLRQRPLAAVHVIWDEPNLLPFDTIGFDSASGVCLATRHLIESGHKNIRFVVPGWFDRNNLPFWLRTRLQGFYRALTSAGLCGIMPSDVMLGTIDYAQVEFGADIPIDAARWRTTGEQIWRKLAAEALPDAVVAINDQTARALVEAARRDGYNVPGDLSVVGFDDRYDSAAFGLTTVHVPVQLIGETAAALLSERIAVPRPDKLTRVSLTPSLVVRKTTGPRIVPPAHGSY